MAPNVAASPTTHDMVLPVLAARPADIGRLARELEVIDSTIRQHELRKTDRPAKLPHTSHLMDQLINTNQLDLYSAADRLQLQRFIEHISKKSPVLHMSFSADPSNTFIEKLMTWIRKEIHPYALLTVGLQPNIGAGCILRTTNKYFDLSLRQNFVNKREMLLKKIVEATRAPGVNQ